ncbi:MAG TPA: hypothetical protein VFZ34_27190 [Blastocatellia bacterium]|nr:hypothetical protein [Blastocatellia bacterium]
MQPTRPSRVKRALRYTVLLIMLAFIVTATWIVGDGLHDEIHSSDVAIIPGNTVERDGRPSARLRARLDQAITLYR